MAKRTARLLGLESALRPSGRPGKERKEGANDAKQPKKQPVPLSLPICGPCLTMTLALPEEYDKQAG